MSQHWHSALALISLEDPFLFWRFLLLTVVTIYTTITLAQTAWAYYVYLTAPDRYTSLLRRYVTLHTLRLRTKTFRGDLAIIALQLLALTLIACLHHLPL